MLHTDPALIAVDDAAFWDDPALLQFTSSAPHESTPTAPRLQSWRPIVSSSSTAAEQRNTEYFDAFPSDLDEAFRSPSAHQPSCTPKSAPQFARQSFSANGPRGSQQNPFALEDEFDDIG